MQKNVHFYLTYALSMNVAMASDKAEKVVWANQYPEDLTESEQH
jgi:hypothetical protein